MRSSKSWVARLSQIASLVLLPVVLSGCGAQSTGPHATALVRVRVSGSDLMPAEQHAEHLQTGTEAKIFKHTQAELIKSPFVLNSALRKPQIAQLPAISRQDNPVDYLAQKLDVSFPDESEIMRISLYCEDSEQSTTILDAILDSYMENIAQAEREERTKTLETLRSQHQKSVRDINEIDQEYDASKTSEPTEKRDGSSTDLTPREAELESLRTTVAEMEREIRTLEMNLHGPPRITLLQRATSGKAGGE